MFLTPLGWLDASLGCCGIVPPRLRSNGKNLEVVLENELDLFFLGANFEVNGFEKMDQPCLKKNYENGRNILIYSSGSFCCADSSKASGSLPPPWSAKKKLELPSSSFAEIGKHHDGSQKSGNHLQMSHAGALKDTCTQVIEKILAHPKC